ncbi:MAG: zinc-ribbon domain containing protein [Archangium sp.]
MKVTCPCCGKERNAAELLALESSLSSGPWWAEPGWTVEAAKRQKLRWACRECLKSRRATRANTSAQAFCDHPPHLAYFDERVICRGCNELFVFTASEQRTWFERFKFLVQSKAVRCAKCRRSRREHAKRQTELRRIMKSLDETSAAQLAKAAYALMAVGSHQKAAVFLRRATNLAATPAARADFIRELETLTPRVHSNGVHRT